jgi:hypothetical protein
LDWGEPAMLAEKDALAGILADGYAAKFTLQRLFWQAVMQIRLYVKHLARHLQPLR